MNKIILLVGDSGAGKDFVLSAIKEYDQIEVVRRFISRSPRDNEQESISSIFNVPIDKIKKLDYYYEGIENGQWYGIFKLDLDLALAKSKSPIVVCPNYENYLQINNDYRGNVVPYFIYRGYSDEELEKWRLSLIARGSSLEEIESREKKETNILENYMSNISKNMVLMSF